jgi:hypothetical protein
VLEVNPFDDLIVKEPRRREPVVSGLNEEPLRVLTTRFERLTAGAPPRRSSPADQALLVTSAQPGFGKSHLIGRLCRELHGRATLVYVRPFQNSELAFQSLLSAAVKEMHFPDRADWTSWDPSEPTQLDALAHGVLGNLVADVMERHGDGDAADLARIRREPLEAFGRGTRGDPWADWMRQNFPEIRVGLERALARRGTVLQSAEWLPVLFAYGYGYPDRELRQACLDWMAGQSLSGEQAAAIGLRAAEVPDADVAAESINHVCRQRLVDLCELASFYRPFVFCFDQTEAYGHAALLARTFGMVVATLVNEAANHLTLITSNQNPWRKTIAPHFEDADAQRIAAPPLVLEGLTRSQAEELIRLRLAANGRSPEECANFLEARWLAAIFKTERTRIGTREFLQQCRVRWERPDAVLEPEPEAKPPAPALEGLYEARRVNILAEPKRLVWDSDTLQWLVKTCAAGLPDVEIDPVASRYFSVTWRLAGQTILFGFEAGSNWKRWEAIAREAQRRREQLLQFKAVFLRGEEQPVIPGADWLAAQSIQEARRDCLHILCLSRDDFAALYAGYDLYADALSGDIPAYGAAEVLAFLRGQFGPWWKRFLGAVESDATPAPTLALAKQERRIHEEVRRIVAAEKFLSVDEVIVRLGAPASREDVLKACGYSAEIRVHAHPKMTVLQWQNT